MPEGSIFSDMNSGNLHLLRIICILDNTGGMVDVVVIVSRFLRQCADRVLRLHNQPVNHLLRWAQQKALLTEHTQSISNKETQQTEIQWMPSLWVHIKWHYFSPQLYVAASCQLVRGINVTHSAEGPHARQSSRRERRTTVARQNMDPAFRDTVSRRCLNFRIRLQGW